MINLAKVKVYGLVVMMITTLQPSLAESFRGFGFQIPISPECGAKDITTAVTPPISHYILFMRQYLTLHHT